MSDKERLENLNPIIVDNQGNVTLKGEDYHWLMEQEERIEELELEKDGWKYTAQCYYMTNKELREQRKRYREALEFYADKKSWMNRKVTILMDCEPTDVEDCPAIFDDGGNIARQALEGE